MTLVTSPLSISIYSDRSAMPGTLPNDLATDCAICYDKIAHNAPRALHAGAKGGDIYHPTCLEKWIRSKQDSTPTCPGCRAPIDGSVFATQQERLDQIDDQRRVAWTDSQTATINLLGSLWPLGVTLWNATEAHSGQMVMEGCKLLTSYALGTLNTLADWDHLELRYIGTPLCPSHVVQDVMRGIGILGMYWLIKKKPAIFGTFAPVSTSLTCLWDAGKRWFELGQEKAQILAEKRSQ